MDFSFWHQLSCNILRVSLCMQVVQTDMFNHFLKERFAQKQDFWTALEEKTRPFSRNSFAENDRY